MDRGALVDGNMLDRRSCYRIERGRHFVSVDSDCPEIDDNEKFVRPLQYMSGGGLFNISLCSPAIIQDAYIDPKRPGMNSKPEERAHVLLDWVATLRSGSDRSRACVREHLTFPLRTSRCRAS